MVPIVFRKGTRLALAAWLALSACDSPEAGRDGAVGLAGAPSPGDAARDEAVPRPAPAPEDPVRRVTGARARVVWIQDVGTGTDIGGEGDRLLLMGYDTDDGRGERPILEKEGHFVKPLLTPLGDRVVFSDLRRGAAFIVNWDGTGLRRLAEGFALATWIDPQTRTEWVYLGTDEAPTDPPSYRTVRRHRIDRPEVGELVWNRRPVSGNSFQVSADGRLAGGLFPWPRAGVVELPNGAWRRLGRGCWTALANGPRPLFWYFDGDHRTVTIVDVRTDERWRVRINTAPGIDGYEVYHPRWTNDPRFLAMTGPYTVGEAANKIRGGGPQVEIYLGRFAADFRTVESWARVTNNARADFSPDAWIDPSGPAADGLAGESGENAGPERAASSKAPDRRAAASRGPLVVEARVLEAFPIPSPASILPYRRALLVNEYEVLRVLEGTVDEAKILVAHWVIRDGEVLATAERKPGTVLRLSLAPYDERPELEGERLIMDTDELDLPLYYDVGS